MGGRYLPLTWVLCSLGCYVLANKAEIERHLEMGKQFLAKGQFSDALTHYHAAIELDPTNYQTYYRRATVLLATGKSKAALPDLDKVVQLKPDFTAALVQRGNVFMKLGELKKASADFWAAAKADPSNNEIDEKLRQVKTAEDYTHSADEYIRSGDCDSAEQLLSKAIEFAQWDADLYRKRAKCYEQMGDIQKAISDIRTVTKLVPDSKQALFHMAELYYGLGDVESSLTQIRECLKLDPDDKQCFPHYKKVKKLAKMRGSLVEFAASEKWMECLEKAQQIQKFETNNDAIQLDVFRYSCKCNANLGHLSEAIFECSEVLNKIDENDLDVLINRAEAYILNEQFEDAVRDYEKAVNAHDDSRRAKEGLNKAQRLLKQSKKKDYYKILGVKRNANKREIMKAYRKLAQKWHPDNFSDDAEKKKAEEKFISIASAKEVLTDPEKREKFDRGEDPLDPEAQQGGGHPFHGHPFHGFNPFGNDGGFSFKFNFG
ncbi:hypothetical protein QR680_015354 [Steinernema hermaphroditum]|uniref:J domain-containing protein n=1 Tax=Steinernema hermaphroditum TaxID=289476 RepID=A0AA39LKP2_9BILA|nr:hypothetical protein QR680_015354 [Steinernema hermaphroditum]